MKQDYPKILDVIPAGGEVLLVHFALGHDPAWFAIHLSDFISSRKKFLVLRTDKNFFRAKVEEFGGAVEWVGPGLDLGIGGDFLYRQAMIQNGLWDDLPGDLESWKRQEGLTHARMAEILGVSERTIANYLTHPEDVPQYIKMAVHAHRHRLVS